MIPDITTGMSDYEIQLERVIICAFTERNGTGQTFMTSSGLKPPKPAMPMPAFPVPYAAPIAVNIISIKQGDQVGSCSNLLLKIIC